MGEAKGGEGPKQRLLLIYTCTRVKELGNPAGYHAKHLAYRELDMCVDGIIGARQEGNSVQPC